MKCGGGRKQLFIYSCKIHSTIKINNNQIPRRRPSEFPKKKKKKKQNPNMETVERDSILQPNSYKMVKKKRSGQSKIQQVKLP